MSSKAFTAQVFRWLYQVNGDHGLPASAAKVAIYLAPNFNEDEGGAAWPSCKTIGDAVGKSESTIISVIRALAERGHLRIEWGKQGRGHSNRYWMIEKARQADLFADTKPLPAKVLTPEKTLASAAVKPQSTERKPWFSERKPWPAKETLSKTHRRTIEGKKDSRASRSTKTIPASAPLDSKQEDSRERKKKKKPGGDAASFERFWAAYPKRVAIDKARKAFAAVIRKGASAEALIEAATRYAAASVQQEPRWIKHPANWLYDGDWRNSPPPRAGGPPIIDNATGEEIPTASPRRYGPKTWAEVAAEIPDDGPM